MAGKIFISYRRGDEPGVAQALYGRLEKAFGARNLFFDVDSIPPGKDFVKVLEKQISRADIVLVVIGKDWASAADEQGRRRLTSPTDFVRIEIESALRLDKLVVPVLVYGAQMPTEADLPEPMQPLARRHASRISHESFGGDTTRLVAALKASRQSKPDDDDDKSAPARKRRWIPFLLTAGIGVAIVVAVLALSGQFAGRDDYQYTPPPDQSEAPPDQSEAPPDQSETPPQAEIDPPLDENPYEPAVAPDPPAE